MWWPGLETGLKLQGRPQPGVGWTLVWRSQLESKLSRAFLLTRQYLQNWCSRATKQVPFSISVLPHVLFYLDFNEHSTHLLSSFFFGMHLNDLLLPFFLSTSTHLKWDHGNPVRLAWRMLCDILRPAWDLTLPSICHECCHYFLQIQDSPVPRMSHSSYA